MSTTTIAPAVTPTPTAPARVPRIEVHGGKAMVTVSLEPEMILACEDQASAMGVRLDDWLQQTINDALRSYMGI